MVPENRQDPGSDLIALPVVRIRATGGDPAEPIFRLEGGPGITNMSFPTANRLTDRHDVVLVGYRGVDGSAVLECPEVESALQESADFACEESLRRYAEAFADCAQRLAEEGVDLDGYSLAQRVDDLEAARQALGYERINLISENAGTRTAMIYAWRYPESIHRSVMMAVNPPGHFLWDPAVTDDQLDYYANLCAKDDGCAARTDDLAASIGATAADMPDRWGFLPIKEGNVRAATLWGLFHTTQAAAPLHRRGRFGPRASAWLRTLAPIVVGLGGWFLAVLIVSSLWPAVFVGSRSVAVVSMGTAIGLGIYLAWVHSDWTPQTRYGGLAAALAGSFLGAWLGSHVAEGLAGSLTAVVGATITANLALLALLALDIIRDRHALSQA